MPSGSTTPSFPLSHARPGGAEAHREAETGAAELRAARAALQDAEERYRRLVDTIVGHAPMVLFALDGDGVFTLSEGKALERLGLEPAR